MTQHRRAAQAWLRTSVVALMAASGLQCTCADHAYRDAFDAERKAAIASYRHAGTPDEAISALRSRWSAQNYRIVEPGDDFEVRTDWTEAIPEERHRLLGDVIGEADGVAVRIDVERQRREPPTWGPERRSRPTDRIRVIAEALAPAAAKDRTADELLDLTYEVSPRVLFDEVQRNAADLYYVGFTTSSPPIDRPALTDWVELDGRTSRRRLEVQLLEVEGGHRLSLWEIEQTAQGERAWQPSSRERGFDQEFALIQDRDTVGASAIETRAREAGQAAFDQARSRGAIACSDFCRPPP